jgi:hypothetical protein
MHYGSRGLDKRKKKNLLIEVYTMPGLRHYNVQFVARVGDMFFPHALSFLDVTWLWDYGRV